MRQALFGLRGQAYQQSCDQQKSGQSAGEVGV
jgi:hypothetical protein